MELNFPKIEQEILRFWKEKKIFEKSVKQRARARGFIFYEGPPTANGRPGIHHVLNRVYKDIICRYKTMRGFRVLRKAGWDTHGLPVELEVEKKLGLKSKKEIEKYGIADFNKQCRASVWQYKQDWEKLTERIGFWLDMENPYVTYENDYIETLWWIIKQIYQKGLLYKDHKVVPYCPRCGTSLSSHEVALGYKKIKEPSIYVKFKLKQTESLKLKANSYLLVWTTTPWTLPGNAAVAVNSELIYVKVKVGDEYLILAKERMGAVGINGQVVEELKGSDLVGLEYESLFGSEEARLRIVAGDFVSLDEGTGLVHIAPAFGEDDMRVGKENNLQVLLTVDEEGKMIAPNYEWDKMFVKDADPLIIKDLKEKEMLFKEELYEHDYPFCWRCSSPLLYYAKESWFINMQKVKERLIKNNQKINWVPAYLKEGRFGEWLKDLKDWAFSRERYWGTPLPIWQCSGCGHKEVLGSLEDLVSLQFSTNHYYIFRHGHSDRQVKNIASCWPEITPLHLTKRGIEEARRSAQKLKDKKIDIIFFSDLARTKETAEIISQKTGDEVIADERLREINVGIFNGKNPKLFWDFLAKNGNHISVKAPNGDSLMDTGKRMYDFLKEINEKYQNKNIVIVSHELPLSLLEGLVRGWPLERIIKFRRENKEKLIKTGQWREIKFKNLPYDEKMELNFHKPFIDSVKFKCKKCYGIMERVPEVADVWFDSGSMPFAQHHYPFEKKNFQFPADYISEAIDQTRGWFYTLLAVSSLLGFGAPYKNVISLGHVLDEKGEKMSKSKGNVVDPWKIIEKYGADSVRWHFYTVNQPGDPKLFSEKDIDQALKKFILTLKNSFTFYQTYITLFKRSPKKHYYAKNILDKWVISKLNELILEATEKLDKYDVTGAARSIEDFVVNDLSLWYIRRSRKRFEEAEGTLAHVLLTVSKLTAPFIPFLSEEIYRAIGNRESGIGKSAHLADWPKADKKLINKRLNQNMDMVRGVVASALAERAKVGIKVRQPLSKLQITNYKLQKEKELLKLIKDEVNVKNIGFGKTLALDTQITPELKKEGEKREIVRNVKDLRKELGLSSGYAVKSIISTISIAPEYMSVEELKIEIGAKSFKVVVEEKEAVDFDAKKEIAIDGKKHFIWIKK